MKLIPLTKGKHAMVDDADCEFLMQWSWHVKVNDSGNCYAVRSERKGDKYIEVRMHRMLCDGPCVDHINGNSLDNQRVNLRSCTNAQNSKNKRMQLTNKRNSKYKGVYRNWNKPKRHWHARVVNDGKEHSLGYYFSQEDAAKAYDRAALKYHAQFARLNFPLDQNAH